MMLLLKGGPRDGVAFAWNGGTSVTVAVRSARPWRGHDCHDLSYVYTETYREKGGGGIVAILCTLDKKSQAKWDKIKALKPLPVEYWK